MDLRLAEQIALGQMQALGFGHWTLKWNSKKSTAGECLHFVNIINLSRHVIGLHDVDFLFDTIRHELAHAKVGPGKGHGVEWQKQAAEFGAAPSGCYTAAAEKKNWVAWCPTGGHELQGSKRYRRPKGYQEKVFTCIPCKKAGAIRPIIEWKAI